jgi:hypothetical protein
LLELAQQAQSKREDTSTQLISTAVANVMTLLKSYLPDLDVEILRKDFAVDDAEPVARMMPLMTSCPPMISRALPSPRTMTVLGTRNSFQYAAMNNLLMYKFIT